HARRTPGVPQVLERHERRSQLLRARPVAAVGAIEERREQARAKPYGTGPHPRKFEVAQVADRRALSHSADDAMSIDAPEESLEIGIAPRIVEDDRILDRHGHAVVDQTANRVETSLFVAPESVLGFQIDDEGCATGFGNFADAGLHPTRI